MKKTKNARTGATSHASQTNAQKKYYRQAKFLLETFNENRMKRRAVEAELRKGRRFTRDDAIYLITGTRTVRYNADRVQSSPKSDAMADKILEIDEVIERMNREASSACFSSVPYGIANTLHPKVELFTRPPSGTGTGHTRYGTSGAGRELHYFEWKLSQCGRLGKSAGSRNNRRQSKTAA